MANYLIDDFNDGVLDPLKIDTFDDVNVTESGGKLLTPAGVGSGSSHTGYTIPLYDLTKGRLCAQLTKTGTNHADVYTYFGIWDTAYKVYGVLGRTSTADMTTGSDQLGASSSYTNNDTTVGMGPSWVSGTYLGVSYVEGTRTLTFAKSTNLTSWTTIRTVVVTTPAFAFRRAGLMLGAANFAPSSASNIVCQWDNLTYVATDSALRVKVRYGGAWVYASVKVRDGGTWKRPITRVRNAGNWHRPV